MKSGFSLLELIFAIVVLAIIVYNQMLLLNEVNKRLLLMTRESIEKERQTLGDLEEALKNIESMSNDIKPTIKPTENEDSFDPFNYQRPEE
jgi:prepilin-type N-terminal cleavage/methylation domain-containing protein